MSVPLSTTARVLRSSLRAVPYPRTHPESAFTALPGRFPGLAVPALPVRHYNVEATAHRLLETTKNEKTPLETVHFHGRSRPYYSANTLSVSVPGRNWLETDFFLLRNVLQKEFYALPTQIKPCIKGFSASPERPSILMIHLRNDVVADLYFKEHEREITKCIAEVIGHKNPSVRSRTTQKVVVIKKLDIATPLAELNIKSVSELRDAIALDLVTHNELWGRLPPRYVARTVRILQKFNPEQPTPTSPVSFSVTIPESLMVENAFLHGIWAFGQRKKVHEYNPTPRAMPLSAHEHSGGEISASEASESELSSSEVEMKDMSEGEKASEPESVSELKELASDEEMVSDEEMASEQEIASESKMTSEPEPTPGQTTASEQEPAYEKSDKPKPL